MTALLAYELNVKFDVIARTISPKQSSLLLTLIFWYYLFVNNRQYYVYILFNKKNGTLYVGVTNDLVKRVWEHKNKAVEGFTQKYGVDKLGYYEVYANINSAITREKQLKSGNRKTKLELIELNNPDWQDLYFSILD